MRPPSRSRRESARATAPGASTSSAGTAVLSSSVTLDVLQRPHELALRLLPLRRWRALVRTALAEQRRARDRIALARGLWQVAGALHRRDNGDGPGCVYTSPANGSRASHQ